MAEGEPLINELRVGGVVEIHGLDAQQVEALGRDVNGELGQLVYYDGAEGKFYVCLLCGAAEYFDPKNVRAAGNLKKPGEGGGARSFDVLVAAIRDSDALGNEISMCLLEKGFCVLRFCHDAKLAEPALDALRDMREEGGLARFPEEVEEGYLGTNCKGTLTWLDYDSKETERLANCEHIAAIDGELSYVSQLIQPYSGDVLSSHVDERTPALVSLSLTDADAAEYPFPEADDRILGTFLETWRRTLLRSIYFSGLGTASVRLDVKAMSAVKPLPHLAAEVELEAMPGTLLLFRPDVYEYTCDTGGEEALMVVASLLAPAPQVMSSEVDGDFGWLLERDGPPRPPGEVHTYVINAASRLPASFDHQWAMFGGASAGTDGVVEIPHMRYDIDIYYSDNSETYQPWQSTTRHQSYVDAAENFDNKHFEISNGEAYGMDPVMRNILETGAMNLAMIGVTKRTTNRKSVHAGCAVGNDKLDWSSMPKDLPSCAMLTGTTTALAILANRFNFVFNMKGPSFVCDTACSASLTSSHCARLMMQKPEYDPIEWFVSMGAHLCLSPGPFVGCSQAHMTSVKGRSLTFNASADGYLRGEGISGFLMKYGDFKDASDAIFRASNCGQDGRSASLTAPNGPAQEEMVTRTVKEARMTPPESTVWECHGTGTSLGDPIEVGAVRKVQVRMRRSEPLMLASIKSNIGHMEGGAAMGGMVKCILMCKHTMCCPTLHLRTLNPHLEHAAFDAVYETELACFAYTQGHSQVSSFGFGGSNGHGIFWGQSTLPEPNLERIFRKKLASRAPPEVRVLGSSPDEWDADFPDSRKLDRDGTAFSIRMSPDDDGDTKVKWELVEGAAPDPLDDVAYYAISGNFNDWADDRMVAGSVPGAHVTTIEVPDSGSLEFRFLVDGDPDKVLGPATPGCTRKTEAIIGPRKGITNAWAVRASPQSEVTVQLFVQNGARSTMWVVEKDS